MSTFDAFLWGLAAALALAAGWLSLPRPPTLDWERLFKLAMVTAVRGEVERSGGSAADWLAAGRRLVLYHPAGRDAVMKLLEPDESAVAVPALPGERALVAELAALAGVPARLQRAYAAGADAPLYEDPGELGPAWDLAARLGQGADWDALAERSEALREALRRRNEHRRWVILEDPTRDEPAAALCEALMALGIAAQGVRAADPEALAGAWEALVPEPSDRLVLVAIGAAAPLALRTLRAELGLRDRVLAVVLVSADFGGHESWLATEFTHANMDTELNRRTPYFYLSFVEVDREELGEAGRPAAAGVLPSPPVPETGRAAIDAHALGLLPGRFAEARQDLVAVGLAVVVSVYLAA